MSELVELMSSGRMSCSSDQEKFSTSSLGCCCSSSDTSTATASTFSCSRHTYNNINVSSSSISCKLDRQSGTFRDENGFIEITQTNAEEPRMIGGQNQLLSTSQKREPGSELERTWNLCLKDDRMMLSGKPVILSKLDPSMDYQDPVWLQRSLSCKSQYDSLKPSSYSKADMLSSKAAHHMNLNGLQNSPINAEVGGPAVALLPSPGTPSRSSFSGVPVSYMRHKAYINMGRMSLMNGGSSSSVQNSPLSNHIDSRINLRTFPSKWDDAEKWLMSPSHPAISKSPSVTGHAVRQGSETHSKIALHKRIGARLRPSTKTPNAPSSCDRFQPQPTTFKSTRNAPRKNVRTRVGMAVSLPMSVQVDEMHQPKASYSSAPIHDHSNATGFSLIVPDIYSDRLEESTKKRLVVQDPKNKWAGPMKDAATEIISPQASRSTQITPISSSNNSRSPSPLKTDSTVRPNTPVRGCSNESQNCLKQDINSDGMLELERCHIAKLEQREGRLVESREPFPNDSVNAWNVDARSASEDGGADSDDGPTDQISAWEKAKRMMFMAKYARKEAQINAWESHQKAKAEAELRKLEARLEKVRAQTTQKVMEKAAAAQRRAEEMRATARAQQAEQLAKALEQHHRHGKESAPSSATARRRTWVANARIKQSHGFTFTESIRVCFSRLYN